MSVPDSTRSPSELSVVTAVELLASELAAIPQEKDRMKQTSPNRNRKKGRKRRTKKISINNNARKKTEDSTQGEYVYTHTSGKERAGGVAPRRNNRTTESATKESREAKREAKKAIQETNGKRQDERTKTNEKGTRKGNTENDKRVIPLQGLQFLTQMFLSG